MKKIIVAALLLFVVGHPPRADADTTDMVTSTTTVTFIANPNLPKSPAPGLPPGNNPIEMNPNEVTTPNGLLPITGDGEINLLPAGLSLILLATVLYLTKKKSYVERI